MSFIYNFCKIGRASCRERVCQYVGMIVVAVFATIKDKDEEEEDASKHNFDNWSKEHNEKP